jgi:hypothetical protein
VANHVQLHLLHQQWQFRAVMLMVELLTHLRAVLLLGRLSMLHAIQGLWPPSAE